MGANFDQGRDVNPRQPEIRVRSVHQVIANHNKPVQQAEPSRDDLWIHPAVPLVVWVGGSVEVV